MSWLASDYGRRIGGETRNLNVSFESSCCGKQQTTKTAMCLFTLHWIKCLKFKLFKAKMSWQQTNTKLRRTRRSREMWVCGSGSLWAKSCTHCSCAPVMPCCFRFFLDVFSVWRQKLVREFSWTLKNRYFGVSWPRQQTSEPQQGSALGGCEEHLDTRVTICSFHPTQS